MGGVFFVFDHQCIPESIRQAKEYEFIDFHQENITIVGYEAKLKELANFVTTLDMDDTRRAPYFESGMRDNVRKIVKAHCYQYYSNTVKCARILEKDYLQQQTKKGELDSTKKVRD